MEPNKKKQEKLREYRQRELTDKRQTEILASIVGDELKPAVGYNMRKFQDLPEEEQQMRLQEQADRQKFAEERAAEMRHARFEDLKRRSKERIEAARKAQGEEKERG